MIQLIDVAKTHRRGQAEVHALRGVTSEIPEHKFTFIIGPSGSGKSSLLYLIGALDEPTGGDIIVQGQRLSQFTRAQRDEYRRHKVGFVFQNFNLLNNLTAVENVLIPYLPTGEARKKRPEAEALLRRVGLGDRLDHRPSQLSGGEQQRVSIARAFVNRPLILLADEPTGNLDPATSVGIMKLLDRINRTGTTVVMATHDRGIVDTMRRRVIELDRGSVVRDQARGVYE